MPKKTHTHFLNERNKNKMCIFSWASFRPRTNQVKIRLLAITNRRIVSLNYEDCD